MSHTTEQAKLYMRKRRARDAALREKERQASRRWREAHPESYEINRARIKAQRQADIVKFLLRGVKARSVKRGYDFDLTIDWARKRWTAKCEITGLEFDWSRGVIGMFSPSIDRIDSARGYTQDNCRFILVAVNSLKGSGTDQQMLMVAKAVVEGLSCRT